MTMSPSAASSLPIAALLERLEALSREHPQRVLRLRGQLPPAAGGEPFELLIFRGFSSSTTHPTAEDPDQPALPEGTRIEGAELLAGPLRPGAEQVIVGPVAVDLLLTADAWA